MIALDESHDPARRSWVEKANLPDAEFPIQNLPFGMFRTERGARLGVAIGGSILDLVAIAELLGDVGGIVTECEGKGLAPLIGRDPKAWSAVRRAVGRVLERGASQGAAAAEHLVPMSAVEMLMPLRPGGYIDFFASIEHATNVGRIFRPDNPLLPNYKYVPIAYNGRVSTIRPSGAPVQRPRGQQRPQSEGAAPAVAPSRALDYEMELGFFLGGTSRIGEPVPVDKAWEHIFGFCLLNDWSARDIQAWEYQPLGPFLGKSFATTISPWIVTAEALKPFRAAPPSRPDGDPQPLPYLAEPAGALGGIDIRLEAHLRSSAEDSGATKLGGASSLGLYWTPGQMVAHMTSNGCNVEAGDLLGSGTISSRDGGLGSLIEITRGAAEPLKLKDGTTRRYLEDGDELILRGRCERDGFVSIGFGACAGRIGPAL
ncbi:fumarylacetoacetase [Bradyrhizobium sp.]|uniref:fumarylacetoacetase n=1 Tax=Bradyrhizobium sp. TaxID=376 RepID=UPI0039E5DD85